MLLIRRKKETMEIIISKDQELPDEKQVIAFMQDLLEVSIKEDMQYSAYQTKREFVIILEKVLDIEKLENNIKILYLKYFPYLVVKKECSYSCPMKGKKIFFVPSFK